MKTQLEKVKEFHEVFGVYTQTTPGFPPENVVELRRSLNNEENKELNEAIDANDLIEVADALADILYVTNGAASAFGIPLDEIFNIVHDSNMDKTCSSEEHAQETVAHYASLPEPVETYYKENNGRWVVYRKADNKVLKRKGWTAPDFSHLLK